MRMLIIRPTSWTGRKACIKKHLNVYVKRYLRLPMKRKRRIGRFCMHLQRGWKDETEKLERCLAGKMVV